MIISEFFWSGGIGRLEREKSNLGQRSEVRGRRSEVGGRRPEVKKSIFANMRCSRRSPPAMLLSKNNRKSKAGTGKTRKKSINNPQTTPSLIKQ